MTMITAAKTSAHYYAVRFGTRMGVGESHTMADVEAMVVAGYLDADDKLPSSLGMEFIDTMHAVPVNDASVAAAAKRAKDSHDRWLEASAKLYG